MNITIISNNYYPEDSGIGLYSSEMAEFLAKNHNVSVITAFPYYPQWEIYKEYQSKGDYYRESINNVEILRFKAYTPKKPTFFTRVLQMIHFFIGSLYNVLKIKKSDVIIVVVPFTISIILGYILKIRRGGKLIIHTQDFEFDAAFETGILKNKLFQKIFLKAENKLYSISSLNSTISYGMIEKLKVKHSLNNYYFPNWIDANIINPSKSKRITFYNHDKFNILYSGNIGKKQDWDLFLTFAKELEQHTKIHINLVGDGASKDEVIKSISELKNITYKEPVLYSELNNLLCNADIHILFQKDAVIDTVMPSKILGMMASAKASIVTGHKDSEIKNIFEKSQGGFYFPNTQFNSVIEKVIYLADNKEILDKIGQNARSYITSQFSKENILNKFSEKIKNL